MTFYADTTSHDYTLMIIVYLIVFAISVATFLIIFFSVRAKRRKVNNINNKVDQVSICLQLQKELNASVSFVNPLPTIYISKQFRGYEGVVEYRRLNPIEFLYKEIANEKEKYLHYYELAYPNYEKYCDYLAKLEEISKQVTSREEIATTGLSYEVFVTREKELFAKRTIKEPNSKFIMCEMLIRTKGHNHRKAGKFGFKELKEALGK